MSYEVRLKTIDQVKYMIRYHLENNTNEGFEVIDNIAELVVDKYPGIWDRWNVLDLLLVSSEFKLFVNNDNEHLVKIKEVKI